MNAKFRKTLEIARSDLLSRGVECGYVCPPILRLLWKLGIPLRPLICMSNFEIFVFLSIVAGIGMMILGGVITGRFESAVIGPIFGFSFGVHMTLKIIRERRRINPPSWDAYTNLQNDAEHK